MNQQLETSSEEWRLSFATMDDLVKFYSCRGQTKNTSEVDETYCPKEYELVLFKNDAPDTPW